MKYSELATGRYSLHVFGTLKGTCVNAPTTKLVVALVLKHISVILFSTLVVKKSITLLRVSPLGSEKLQESTGVASWNQISWYD